MELWKALAQLYPDAQPLVDYVLVDDGDGAYIADWRLDVPEPTEAELTAAIVAFDAAQSQREQAETTERNDLRALLAKLDSEDLTVLERRRVLRFLLRRALRS